MTRGTLTGQEKHRVVPKNMRIAGGRSTGKTIQTGQRKN